MTTPHTNESPLPELLADLLAKLVPELVSCGLEAAQAAAAARAVVDVVRLEMGGRSLWFRRDDDHSWELLWKLIAPLMDAIRASGVESTAAARAARRAVEVIRREWRAQSLYIARGKAFEVEEMRRIIATEWTSKNTQVLCRRFNITERRLRQLHAEFHRARGQAPAKRRQTYAEWIAERNLKLFGE